MTGRTATVERDLTPRVTAAADRVRDARAALTLELGLLRRVVVEAVDAGMSQRAIATAAGYKSVGRVHQLLAQSAGDDE